VIQARAYNVDYKADCAMLELPPMEHDHTIRDHEAEQIVRNLGIPPCPEVLTTLLREMRKDETDYMTISNLISGDVGLAAAMLKTVNSPFFGLRNKVTSVHQAITMLGLRNVKEIVTGLLLRNMLPAGESKAMQHFWDTSSGIAMTASMLAKPLAGLDREDAYTFALFRDCGIPLMVKRFPQYDRFYADPVSAAQSLTDAESAKFGIDHARVGAQLARTWHLPEETCRAISMSHDYPSLVADDAPDVARKLVALGLAAEYIYARCTSNGACADWTVGGDAAVAALGTSEEALEEQLRMVEGILGQSEGD
jgi:HD-like signal output (HDOD) protein